MKMIKVDTHDAVTIVDLTFTDLRNTFRSAVEHVRPNRLASPYCMLVDGEGLCKGLEQNPFGSYLYETDKHGFPIAGDIYLAKDEWTTDGFDTVGLDDLDIAHLQTAYFLQSKE